jgi:dTDP-4-amino-4,6-dideoxygalactose transaminase
MVNIYLRSSTNIFIVRMRDIQMVDLNAQYQKLGAEIDASIRSVLDSTAFIKGPEVKKFEEELRRYLGCNHVISCANGTDALQIALMALGLNPGDEVITTNFTFIATVEVVALLGFKPVLVEPDPVTFNISVSAIEKAISPRTKAIVPVHLFGQCADMESIMKLAKKKGLYIIEDTAQATGSEYLFADGTRKKAGTMGTIGTTSFFPSKNLGCYGDGGAMFTNDEIVAAKLRSIANHGMKERYHYDDVGVNSRLDTLQAAILLVKLRHLDEFNSARKKAADYYDSAFADCHGLDVPGRSGFSSHIFHQYTIRIRNGRRNDLKKYLESAKIPAMIYYPGPLHSQKAYRYLGYSENDFPVTSGLCSEVISLPMHPDLEQEQLDYITHNVLKFFEK